MSQSKRIGKAKNFENSISEEAAMLNGLENHEDTKPWECQTCGKRFSRKYHVSRHQRVHRNVKDGQTEVQTTWQIQPSSDKTLTESDITASYAETTPTDQNKEGETREKHTGTRHACHLCDKCYTTKHSLKIHVMSHQNLKPWGCQTCGKRFIRKYHLLRHKPVHQKVISQHSDPDDWDSLATIQPPTIAKSSNQKYLCKICHKIFSNRKSLRVHYLKHLGKRYPCKLCEKSFTSSNGLKLHQLSHDDLRPWICGTCGKQFRTKAHLNRHDKIHVPGLPLNVCEICGKGFHSRQSLKIHSRSHNDNKQYQCPVCGSCFKYRTSLEMHNKIHQKHKDFACLICKRTFAQKKTLQHHLGVHERVKEKNGYILPPKEFCDICGRGLSTKAGLRKHLKRHREGTLKTFNRLSNRKFHVLDNKADQETGRHPHEVEVYASIEQKVQYEVILNENYSDEDEMVTSTRERQSRLDKTGMEIKSPVKCNTEMVGRDLVIESRKTRVSNKINDKDKDVGVSHHESVGFPVRDITYVEYEGKQDLKDMVQSIEDLIVIVQDKNTNDSVQTNEDNDTVYITNKEVLGNESTVTEKLNGAIKDGKDENCCAMEEDRDLKVSSTETLVYRDYIDSEKIEISVIDEKADKNGTTDKPTVASSGIHHSKRPSDGCADYPHGNRHSDGPADCLHRNKPSDGPADCLHSNKLSDGSADWYHSNRSGRDDGEYMSSQGDISDSLSDSGELYIHFEYDSDATEIMDDIGLQEKGHVLKETMKYETSKNHKGETLLPSTDQAMLLTADQSKVVGNDADKCQLTEECQYGTDQSQETMQSTHDKSSTCLENINSTNEAETKSSKENSNLRLVNCETGRNSCETGIGTIFTRFKESCEQIDKDNNEIKPTVYVFEVEQQKSSNSSQVFNSHEGDYIQGKKSSIIHDHEKHIGEHSGKEEDHKRIQSGEVLDRLKCNICVRSFRRKCHLDRHMERVHTDKTDKNKAKRVPKFGTSILKEELSIKKDLGKTINIIGRTSQVNGEKFSKHIKSVDNRKMGTSISNQFKLEVKHINSDQGKTVKSKQDKCDICNKKFKLHNYFRKHMRLCHPEKEIIYKCMREKCDQTFKSRLKYRHHLKSHNASICELCGEIFKGINELVSHVLGQHDAIGKTVGWRVKCMVCSKLFEDETTSIDHFKTHLRTRNVSIDFSSKSFECKVCSKKFLRKQSLKRHTVLHEAGEKPVCENCSKIFSQPGHLERHVQTRACSKDFTCSHCDQQFHTQGHLRVHQRKEHKVQAYKCPLCPKQFATSSGMHRHKQFHIEGTTEMSTLKPFMCNICGNCYSAAHSLTVHMVLHTNKRPFQCDQCGNSYTQRAHLQRHVAVSHKGIKKFKCMLETCGKVFPDNGALMAHMRTHSGEKPFKCVECGNSFSQSSILKCHMKTHSETKEYHCKYCYQQFSTKASAHRHMQRHVDWMNKSVSESFPKPVGKDTKVRPVVKMANKQFKCDLCDKMFTTHRATLAHMKKNCLHRGKINTQTSAGYQKISDARNNSIHELALQHSQQISITSSEETNVIESTHGHIPNAVCLPTSNAVSLRTTEVIETLTTKPDLSQCDELKESDKSAVDDYRTDGHRLEPHARELSLGTQQLVTNTPVPAVNMTPIESFPDLVMMSNVQLPGYY